MLPAVAKKPAICIVAGMSDAEILADNPAAAPVAEPPAPRRRLRGPIQQKIDLFFVERRQGQRGQESPVYDGQGQARRHAVRPGTMLNMVA